MKFTEKRLLLSIISFRFGFGAGVVVHRGAEFCFFSLFLSVGVKDMGLDCHKKKDMGLEQ